MSKPKEQQGQGNKASKSYSKSGRPWFALPAPIRSIFDTFPLKTYPDNPPPQRCSQPSTEHILYIWSIDPSHKSSNLSLNPGCLKWQVYLLSQRIPFRVATSNNHASPSGALPFVIPANKKNSAIRSAPIPSSKISRWAEEVTGRPDVTLDSRMNVYLSLIDQNIRNAWLFNLYLVQDNFDRVASKIYVESQSSNALVRAHSRDDLQKAAKEMILKTQTNLDQEEIYAAADAAFAALVTNLGDHHLFSESETPNEFDASLFAYTHPLLELDSQGLGWEDRRLLSILRKYDPLVQHRNKVAERCII